MKHKITTAHENMIFDEILMMQRILAKPVPNLQSVRTDLKEAGLTSAQFQNMLKKGCFQNQSFSFFGLLKIARNFGQKFKFLNIEILVKSSNF